MTKERVKKFVFFLFILLFFLGTLALYGVGIYNDSEQYITMHIHREPLYPLFLAFFRLFAGPETGLVLAAIIQNVLTACSIFWLIEYLTQKFSLPLAGELVLLALELAPHLVTRYVSALGIFLENSIMSEALCIPLFQFFLLFTLRMVFEKKWKDMAFSLVFAYLLSMTRGQMMTTIIIWLVVVGFLLLSEKRYRKLIMPIAAVFCVFGIRSLTVHTYNYFANGYFMGNTYGPVNTLTNVIYACDEEDGDVFEEGSLEREFFDIFYREADSIQASYRYASDAPEGEAAYLEGHHDMLKFDVLESNLSRYFFGLGKVDYYQQSRMSDIMAGRMLRKLLPACFGQWFYDYLLLCRNGFIRSIAVVNKWINWAAFAIYLSAASLSVMALGKDKKSGAARVMGLALLFIAANVCATSLTIMCLSRYMIYGFSIFYMAFFLLIVELMRGKPRSGTYPDGG